MSLSTWFALSTEQTAARAEALRLRLLRQRWVKEWEMEKARLWAIVETRMNLQRGITRDIREWRVEA